MGTCACARVVVADFCEPKSRLRRGPRPRPRRVRCSACVLEAFKRNQASRRRGTSRSQNGALPRQFLNLAPPHVDSHAKRKFLLVSAPLTLLTAFYQGSKVRRLCSPNVNCERNEITDQNLCPRGLSFIFPKSRLP